ncbi:hypothetical protein FSARC_12145 [Fusarium sarcochroum]|uniref:Uncharacterized protein n=1 Tax=Fusarium sarcochroum TaxID=1208366 RepID=A0A8H4TB59_9HYPO|nr:hypothetical protein FSARC_12145 [Fusarium sarcochroum]
MKKNLALVHGVRKCDGALSSLEPRLSSWMRSAQIPIVSNISSATMISRAALYQNGWREMYLSPGISGNSQLQARMEDVANRQQEHLEAARELAQEQASLWGEL